MNEIEEIHNQTEIIWKTLGMKGPVYGIYEVETEEAMCVYRHVEYCDGKYRYLARENGHVLELRETTKKEELLEWIALELTRTMAQYEVNKKGSPRKFDHQLWLRLQISLLRKINAEWADKRAMEMKVSPDPHIG